MHLLNEAAKRQNKQSSSVLLMPFNVEGKLRSGVMNIDEQTRFNHLYQAYLNELTLQGKSHKALDMYSRCLCQVAVFFNACPDALTAIPPPAVKFTVNAKIAIRGLSSTRLVAIDFVRAVSTAPTVTGSIAGLSVKTIFSVVTANR
jgi:hypothetical protein